MSASVIIRLPKFKIHCDAKHEPQGNILFISHSHSDHTLKTKTPIPKLCSAETEKLVSIRRNRPLTNTIRELSINDLALRLADTGHILGSRALIIENEKKILFTSDFCSRPRVFLGKFLPEKCDYLIIEATFGKEKYIFPPSEEIVKSAKDWVEEQLKKGFPLVLMGYTVGKAQLLCKIFEELFVPIYVDANIKKINDVYRECGVPLLDFECFEQTKQLKIPPWILITSPTSGRAKQMRKWNAKTAIFTGWGVDEESYVYRMKVDRAFPLSDHADFNELVRTVEKCSPAEKVFVTHGFDHEFAAHLRELGFDAQPLSTKVINFSEV